ncbi:MAG: hypothetical protein AAF497_10630 [Planctomycetota bacterium]
MAEIDSSNRTFRQAFNNFLHSSEYGKSSGASDSGLNFDFVSGEDQLGIGSTKGEDFSTEYGRMLRLFQAGNTDIHDEFFRLSQRVATGVVNAWADCMEGRRNSYGLRVGLQYTDDPNIVAMTFRYVPVDDTSRSAQVSVEVVSSGAEDVRIDISEQEFDVNTVQTKSITIKREANVSMVVTVNTNVALAYGSDAVYSIPQRADFRNFPKPIALTAQSVYEDGIRQGYGPGFMVFESSSPYGPRFRSEKKVYPGRPHGPENVSFLCDVTLPGSYFLEVQYTNDAETAAAEVFVDLETPGDNSVAVMGFGNSVAQDGRLQKQYALCTDAIHLTEGRHLLTLRAPLRGDHILPSFYRFFLNRAARS